MINNVIQFPGISSSGKRARNPKPEKTKRGKTLPGRPASQPAHYGELLDIEKYFAIEAEKRIKAGINQYSSPQSKMTEGSKGESAEQAAAALKTNDNYVKAAKKLEKAAARGYKNLRARRQNLRSEIYRRRFRSGRTYRGL